MIGNFIGSPIGEATVASDVAPGVGSAAGVATVTGVGIAIANAVGETAGGSSVLAVGVGLISGVGAAVGSALVLGVGYSFNSAVGIAAGVAVVRGVAILNQVVSRKALQDPVDCVMSGDQQEFRKGFAPFGSLRGIFRE